MKCGANRSDVNAILRLVDQGMDSGKISKLLGIEEKVVKTFMLFDPLKYQLEQEAKSKAEAIAKEEVKLFAEAGARIAVEAAQKKGKL